MPDPAADFVVEVANRNPRVRELVAEVQALDGLREHAGWKALLKKAQADAENFMSSVARRLMAGVAIDQREIDFKRGYLAGALDVIERPERAMEGLEVAARAAYAIAKAEALEEEGESSPYLK